MAEIEVPRKMCLKICVVPQRYILCAMGSLGILNAYTMRICMAMAITEMVKSDFIEAENITVNGSCPADDTGESVNSVKDPELLYSWDDATQGLILGSFFIGYVITHIPGSLLAEHYGAKHVLGIGNLITAIFTLLVPMAMHRSGGDATVLIVLRVIAGLGQGPIYPAMTTMLAQWIPPSERTTIGSVVYAGSQIGTVVANLGTGALIRSTRDWQWGFYVFGVCGVLWFVFWLPLCFSYPDTHPFITDKEKAFLEQNLKADVSKEVQLHTPFREILTSAPVWALVIVQSCHDWGANTLMSDLPKYMKEILKFNVMDNGIWTSIPYVMWFLVSLIAGIGCDYLIKSHRLRPTVARKIFATICLLGPTSFMLAASFAGCNKKLVVAMFIVSMSFYGAFYCVKINAIDLAPNFSGTVMAFANGIGSIGGIFAPYVVGAITGNHTIESWRVVFAIAAGISGSGWIFYLIFGSGDKQSWNDKSVEETT